MSILTPLLVGALAQSAPDFSVNWSNILGPLYQFFAPTDLERLNAAIRELPPRCVRLAAGVSPGSLPFETIPVPWMSAGRILNNSSVRPGGFLHHSAGLYYVQDAASLLAVRLCNVQPGQLILDLCAAPGGKSTALVNQLCGTGVLVANEVIGSRVASVSSALWRTGFGNHLTTNQDAERLAQVLPGVFDCVLVDAPCSGQSMLARGKQSEASLSEHQVAHSAARQRRIMEAAVKLVKPGGRLVYSTCTFAYEENEAIIEGLLKAFPFCESESTIAALAEWQSPLMEGCYRLWPDRDPCAGGFAAAVRVFDDGCSVDIADAGRDRKKRGRSSWQALRVCPGEVSECFDVEQSDFPGNFRLLRRQDKVQLISSQASDLLIDAAVCFTPLATEKSGRYEPEYAAAILRDFVPSRRVRLSDEEAIAFVAGHPVSPAELQIANGWCGVTWRDHRLAWGKVSRSLVKNHLPKFMRQNTVVEG